MQLHLRFCAFLLLIFLFSIRFTFYRFQVQIMICCFLSYVQLFPIISTSQVFCFRKEQRKSCYSSLKRNCPIIEKLLSYVNLENYGAFVLHKRTKKIFRYLCKEQLINYCNLRASITDHIIAKGTRMARNLITSSMLFHVILGNLYCF